jgi:protein-histidine pros-kinase
MPEVELVIPTDRRLLNQIIHTLVSNAIRLTERGEVRIELQRRSQNGRMLAEIGVRDTSPGLRVEDRANIFEPFATVDARTPGQSSGLGLHVSYKLAELLGGRIAFQSEYGKGSTFTLIIPE